MIATFKLLSEGLVFSDSLVECLGLMVVVTGVWAFIKRHNCHHHLCWRLSWHPDATGHPVCKHHHPDHPKHSRIQAAYEKWLFKHGIKKHVLTQAAEKNDGGSSAN